MKEAGYGIILWLLATELREYVDNYEFSKNDEECDKENDGKIRSFKLEPSYDVDYEIEEEIISELYSAEDMYHWYYYQVLTCKNINELPLYLKKLLKQFLPRFLSEYPEFQDAECLKIKDCEDTAE